MKINEILTESQLSEGPILNKIGQGIGKAAGAAVKGVGAVAGGIAGIPKALAKGYRAGKAAVGSAGDDDGAPAATGGGGSAAPTTAAAPAAQPTAAAPAAQPAAAAAPVTGADIDAQGPAGTAPAKVSGAAAQQAIAKTAQAGGGNAERTGQTLYAQVKSQIDQLDKKGKQRILHLLQKSMTQAPAKAAPAAAAQPAAAPAAQPAAGPGSATVGTTPGGKPRVEPNLNAPAPGEQPATAAGKKKPIPKKKVAPSQAEIDADRERLMGVTSDSVIRKGNIVAEGFTLFRR